MRPPGLVNSAGNLCYLNSTLQAIASSPPLLSYLATVQSPGLTPVITALLQLLSILNKSPSAKDPPLRAVILIQAIAASSRSRRELLSSSDQQDAHELFGMIMEAVEEEVSKLEKGKERAFDVGFAVLGQLGRKKSMPRNPYVGWIAQTVRCLVCGYTRDIRHVPEQLLTLYLPPVSSCTLEQCLSEYTKLDPITDYSCRRCTLRATLDRLTAQRDRLSTSSEEGTLSKSKKNRLREVKKLVMQVADAVDAGDFERSLDSEIRIERVLGPAGKELKFARTPDIFSIHLQRSSQFIRGRGAYKNTCQVFFPEILDLSVFCTTLDVDTDKPFLSYTNSLSETKVSTPIKKDLYRLSSLVVHYGSHSFGHYVTYRRTPHSTISPSAFELESNIARPTIAELLAKKKKPSSSASSSSSSDPDETISSSSSSEDDLPISKPFTKVNSTKNPNTISLPSPPLYVDSMKSDWYRISDETVERTDLETVLHSNPFLIFYEKIKEEVDDEIDVQKRIGLKGKVVERWEIEGCLVIAFRNSVCCILGLSQTANPYKNSTSHSEKCKCTDGALYDWTEYKCPKTVVCAPGTVLDKALNKCLPPLAPPFCAPDDKLDVTLTKCLPKVAPPFCAPGTKTKLIKYL